MSIFSSTISLQSFDLLGLISSCQHSLIFYTLLIHANFCFYFCLPSLLSSSQQIPIGLIKQINMMYNTNSNQIKHNHRHVQAFYNLKRILRHSSHTKTSPMRTSYNLASSKKSADKDTELDTLLFTECEPSACQQQKKLQKLSDLRRKKTDNSVQQIYNIKKNAYKTYVRQIYQKINQQLRKKNTYFTLISQNIKQINYTDALITKEVKPSNRFQEQEQKNIKNKIREKIRLERLREQSSSLEKIKQKLFVIKKNNQKKALEIKTTNQFRSARTKNSLAASANITDKEVDAIVRIESIKESYAPQTPTVQPITQKRKDKVFSLKVSIHSNKVNIQEYIPAKKIFNKKDPFVCGLRGEKQSVQQKNREKILSYIDLIWKLNYSNGLYVKPTPEQVTYKAYIGNGNNSLMIKSILKRRFWWSVQDKAEGCNFIWTQLKQNNIFRQSQQASQTMKEKIYMFNRQLLVTHNSEQIRQDQPEQNLLESKFFNAIDSKLWVQHLQKNAKTELTITQKTYLKRLGLLSKKNLKVIDDSTKLLVHNHLQHNFYIGNKKALFYHMKKYYVLKGLSLADALPLTFHIIRGIDDPEYYNFLNAYNRFDSLKKSKSDQKNIWIVKPGEFSNRGNGISVCHSLDDIMVRLKSKEKSSDGNYRTFILQKYIEKPLLYKGRKFDIRHYLLITCFNGSFKAYWYPQGYIRTSSAIFTLKRNGNLFVHLTNDAIQKNSDQYGKYQRGNKISYQKFQNYLDKEVKGKHSKNIFFDKILPQMKELTKNAVKATYLNLDEKRRQHNFQLLGMDFMIDQNYKPMLIQINTNPCLELSCPLLSRLIPSVIQNTFKLCVDPFFPPPEEWNTNKKLFLADNSLEENMFQLIFDETVDGKELEKLFKGDYKISSNIGKIEEDAEVYENDGQEEWEGDNLKKDQ